MISAVASPISTMQPRYMTAMRPHVHETAAMSCAVRLALRLHRDVERRNRLVGDDEVGVGDQHAGNGDALALSAAERMRVMGELLALQAAAPGPSR